MTAFKVRKFHSAPDYEALHVAKITDFPLEQRDYKPYSQVRICFSPEGFHIQLLSFEATPLPASEMTAVFQFGSDAMLQLSLNAKNDAQAFFQTESKHTPAKYTLHTFDGEDLQGIYWGGSFTVQYEQLKPYFGAFRPDAGAIFKGNLYKICTDAQKPHYGSFFPTHNAFSLKLSDPLNFGEFVVIDY